jgi:5-methylcytosine-specific restriction endonuclease McrA
VSRSPSARPSSAAVAAATTTIVAAAAVAAATTTIVAAAAVAAPKKTKAAAERPTGKCCEVTCGKLGCTVWVRSFAVFLCSCFLCCVIREVPRVRWTVRQVRDTHRLTRGTCYYCAGAFRSDCEPTRRKGVWEMDHFHSVSASGRDTLDNIVPSCVPCNGSKGAKSPYAFADERGLVLRCQDVDAATGHMCLDAAAHHPPKGAPMCRRHYTRGGG